MSRLDPDITEEMVAAGQRIASELITASVARTMNGLGGSYTWEEYELNPPKDFDLIQAYIDNRMVSVTAIYLAMHRAKESP